MIRNGQQNINANDAAKHATDVYRHSCHVGGGFYQLTF